MPTKSSRKPPTFTACGVALDDHEIAHFLRIGECLKPKSNGAPQEDVITVRFFRLDNLFILLRNSKLQEGAYLLPIVS
jgi:hypothetical protein